MIRYSQYRSVHHLIDTLHCRTCQHHAAGGKHDFSQCRRNDCGEHCIKCKIRNKGGCITVKIRPRCQEKRCRDKKDKRSFGKCQVYGLRQPARAICVFFCLYAVILNRFLKSPKGIYRLLKHLYHGNATHIFRTCLAHHILGGLILCHKLCVFTAHHGKHGQYRHDCSKQTGCAHAPVKYKHQYHGSDKHGNRPDNISQIMRNQGLGIRGCSIQTVAQQAGCVGIKESERCLHQMLHALFSDI